MNYQIMRKKRRHENTLLGIREEYVPDYESLIANAECEAEADYIRNVRKADLGFAWNMVYVQKQGCGHYEIFQTPCNEYHPLSRIKEVAREHSKEECTLCVMRKLSML